MMKTIIFGSSGFVGSFLVENSEYFKNELVFIDRKKCNLLNQRETSEYVSNLPNDKYNIIILSTIPKNKITNFEEFKSNILLINNILFSIKKLSVNSILFFSSIDVYGKNPTLPINEKTELCPDNYYAASKLINESSILNFKTDVPSVILRMPGIYGSPNDNVSIIGRFTEAIKNNHEIQINGTGAQLRDYIYIEDILKAIELISNNPKSGIFNFVTGYSISISSIINLISSSIGIKPQIIYNKKNSHNDDLIFNNNKFISNYDFFKFTDISNGIKNYLEKIKYG